MISIHACWRYIWGCNALCQSMGGDELVRVYHGIVHQAYGPERTLAMSVSSMAPEIVGRRDLGLPLRSMK